MIAKKWMVLMCVAFFMFPGLAGGQETNNCVYCHSQPTGKAEVDQNYFKWKDSWHAKNNVGCEKCHGGKASEATAAAAHTGVIEFVHKDKQYTYYQALDKQCGECHKQEFKVFIESSHARYLQQGMGPSCVSCHHPKTGHTLTDEEIIASCFRCHGPKLKGSECIPTEVKFIFDLRKNAEVIVEWAKQFVDINYMNRKKTAAGRFLLRRANQEIASVKDEWHRFNLTTTREHLNTAIGFAIQSKGLMD
jgi:hypothetical protein